LNVWATKEFSASASGGTFGPPGFDTATITKGYSVFASVSFRISGPDEGQAAPATTARYHK
jgi:hypothetical protein